MKVRSAGSYRKKRFGKTDNAIEPQTEELNLLQIHVYLVCLRSFLLLLIFS